MKLLLLAVDFLCPLIFFFIGRKLGKEEGRVLRKNSLLVLFAVLLFAPIAYGHFSLAVQGACTALTLFLQFLLLSYSLYKEKILL